VGFGRGADGGEILKLLDFGVAKLIEPGPDGTVAPTQRVGTPQSMAPEQIRGDAVSPATDVYGLGVMLHYLMSGRYPFEAADASEVERMHLEDEPPRLTERIRVPPPLDELLGRTLAKDPAARPSLAEIAAIFADLSTGAASRL
jgi:serine/threonine-protein kinase